MAEFKTKLRQA